MGTRSKIGILRRDGTVDHIYCHWDGYPEHNGSILFNEYNNSHKIFIDEFNSVERDIQNYYFYLRKKQIKDTNLNRFNKIVNKATKAHKIFLEKHSNFQDLNKKYFNLY